MILIIDGYNLLKSTSYKKLVSKIAIEKFIEKLVIYSNIKSHEIIVVFDGGVFPWANSFKKSKVRIVNSGYKQDADSYIIEYLNQNKNKDILIVSSDNEIASYAQNLNLASIDSGLFYKILNQSLKIKSKTKRQINSSSKAKKISININPELDKLMKESIVEDKDSKEIDIGKIINLNKKSSEVLSKIDKKLLSIVKKL